VIRLSLALLALLVEVGCSSSSATAASDASASGAEGCGTSACESVTWPRLVVAVAGTASGGGSTDADVLAVTAVIGGSVAEPMTGGCPDEFDVIDCEYSFYGNPGLTGMELVVSGPGGTSMREIALQEFNYCGNNLAYVHISESSSTEPPVIEDPQYVSPCKLP
jgi:hypothetical protein